MAVQQEIKSQLAKLLATEDLVVAHKQCETAQFNVHTRVLTLPMWEKASDRVYDMLVGHEVGHALFTPDQDPPKDIPHDIVNVCEDARIEKLMKRKYPGIAKTLYVGYNALHDEDFFDIDGEDLTTFNLADRINLYYKVGSFVDLDFDPIEKEIVDLVGAAESFDDVLYAAQTLYDYCKQQIEEPQVPSIENKDISPPEEQGEETFEEQFFDDGVEEEEKIDSTDNGSSGDLEVITDTAFEEGSQQLNDLTNNLESVYVEIPKVNINVIIESNLEIHASLEQSWEEQLIPMDDGGSIADFRCADIEYEEFKNSARKEVNYFVKEFECRKSADSYARASIARTGVLDCSKLYSYKFNEDLFKR